MKGTVSKRCVAEVRQGKLGRFISAEQTVREKDEMAGKFKNGRRKSRILPALIGAVHLRPSGAFGKIQDSKSQTQLEFFDSMHDAHPGAQ